MRALTFIVLAVSLTGCASFYKPRGLGGGWFNYPTGQGNTHVVGFHGNGFTPPGLAREYAFRRAGEYCREIGFRTFTLIEMADSGRSVKEPASVSCTGNNNFGQINAQCSESGGGSTFYPTAELLIECLE